MAKPLRVCTVLIKAKDSETGNWADTDQSRLRLFAMVLAQAKNPDVLLLPGGFFCSTRKVDNYRSWIEEKVIPIVQKLAPNTTVAFGVDVRNRPYEKNHELAYAVTKTKIVAIGRKFKGSDDVELATSPFGTEAESSRTFVKRKRKFYLAVCYDSFGLRQRKVKNELEIEIILNTIHYFDQVGNGHSGHTYFARHGLAGAAKQWRCLVFGAAHFINRPFPANWPSGISWKHGLKDTTATWKYSDNGLKPFKKLTSEDGSFQLNHFRL